MRVIRVQVRIEDDIIDGSYGDVINMTFCTLVGRLFFGLVLCCTFGRRCGRESLGWRAVRYCRNVAGPGPSFLDFLLLDVLLNNGVLCLCRGRGSRGALVRRRLNLDLFLGLCSFFLSVGPWCGPS